MPQKKTEIERERETWQLRGEREREKGSLRSGFKGGERKLIWIFLEVTFWYIYQPEITSILYVCICAYIVISVLFLCFILAFEIEPALLFHWQICRLISCFSPNGFDFLKFQLKCHWFLCIFSVKFLKANNLWNTRSLIFSSDFFFVGSTVRASGSAYAHLDCSPSGLILSGLSKTDPFMPGLGDSQQISLVAHCPANNFPL